MSYRVNPNLLFLHQELKQKRRFELLSAYESKTLTYEDYKTKCQQEDIKSGVILEGSSRSFKTISSIDFIIFIASVVEKKCVIHIMRDTYASFKTTLYNDFNWRLPQYNLSSPFDNRQEVRSFKIFGSKITFIGADSEAAAHGAGCDYLFFNEVIDISKAVRDQAIMRCRKFWWGDLNPKFPEHELFKSLIPRKDVGHLRTTYRDNHQILPQERTQIESYQPVEACEITKKLLSQIVSDKKDGSIEPTETEKHQAVLKANKYDIKTNELVFSQDELKELEHCRYNEETGTADAYMWSVYGLGERRAPEGLIFPHVTWIKELPANCEKIIWGQDFGYTESPSTLVKAGVIGTNIYAERKFYQPTPSFNELRPLLEEHLPKESTSWADPSGNTGGRTMIMDSRNAGFTVYAANTYPGSIKDGIAILKKYKIHLVDCPEWRKEQMGYTKAKAKVNGVYVTLDDPVDKDNHLWDALRISSLMNRL